MLAYNFHQNDGILRIGNPGPYWVGGYSPTHTISVLQGILEWEQYGNWKPH